MIKGLIIQWSKSSYSKEPTPKGFQLFRHEVPVYDEQAGSAGYGDFYRKLITDKDEILDWLNKLNLLHSPYRSYSIVGYLDENNQEITIKNYTGETGKKGLTW